MLPYMKVRLHQFKKMWSDYRGIKQGWWCNIRPGDKISWEFRNRVKLNAMMKCLQNKKIWQWSGHLEIMGESAKSSKCRTFKVGGSLPLGKCRKTQSEEFRSYLKERKVRNYLPQDIMLGSH